MFVINNKEWQVIFVSPTSPYLKRSDNSLTVGMCDSDLQTIYISDRLNGNFLSKVLIHEVCHAAMMSYSIDLSIEQEEIVCDIIASYGREIINIADDIFYRLKRQVA